MKGKVILLDFWATWCGPCFEAFPYLSDLQETYKREGLEVLGVTRFYGEADGMPADEEAEIRSLKKFRLTQSLPYDFVVARGAANHINYGSPSLPTAVIIDRKGVVRYVEAGSGPGREEEIREAVLKLLSEK
jgi:thiol-disulfide isomerase/thioredoxin